MELDVPSVIKTYSRRRMRVAEGDDVVVAPLPDLRRNVVAVAEEADVDGVAVSPHQTPRELGCVDGVVMSPSVSARLIPVSMVPPVTLVDDNVQSSSFASQQPRPAGVVGEAPFPLTELPLVQSGVVAGPVSPPVREALRVPICGVQGGVLVSDAAVPCSTEPVMSSPPASPLAAFVFKVVKPVDAILPAPPVPKRRKKILPSNFVPRRSRRVANLPPTTADHSAAVSVCRQLGFADGEERVSIVAMEHYATLFDQPLSREHLKALAALFGWDAPPGDEVRAADDILVV